MKNLGLYIALILFLTGCSLSKKLPEGKTIYGGGSVKVVGEASKKAKDNLAVDMEEVLAPRTNSMVLGFPYKVWLYYNIGVPKKAKGIRNFLRNKVGQKPVFYEAGYPKINRANLINVAENNGYFKSTATSESITKKYKTKVAYEVNLAPQYFIKEVSIDTSDFEVFGDDASTLAEGTLLKKDKPYNLGELIAERERLSNELQEKGYFYMSPSQFVLEVDTNLNANLLTVKTKLSPNFSSAAVDKYYIREINVLSSAKQGEKEVKTSFKNLQRSGLSIAKNDKSYKPKVFTESIIFRPGELYSRSKQEASLNRLSNLKNFQYIRNRYEPHRTADSTYLDVNYFLTPLKKKSLKGQLSGLTKSNGLYGSEANVSWQNRNVFHGAEILKFEVNGGIDLQFGQIEYGNNYRRLSVAGDLTFPRFLIPFFKQRTKVTSGVPKTNFNLSYEILRRKDFYTLASSNAAFSYFWRKNSEYEHTLTPVYFSLIKASNFSENFVNQILFSENLSDLERYFQILENKLLLGLEYKLNYTPKVLQSSRDRVSFNFGFDVSGNVASLIAKKPEDGDGGYRQIFGVPYEQFAKLDFEGKYFKSIGKTTWANRLFAGFGIPYKNSIMLPQTKQYFSGGSNGLRGFRGRSLGPGKIAPEDVSQELFGANSQGDIKLELSSELRFKASSYIELAAFMDAGNIWTYRDDTFYGEKAKFTGDFVKDLAVDMGVGLRLDFTYLVLRGDFAIPVRKPWLDDPWVFDKISFDQRVWRQNNLIFNLAIAHPF